MTLWGLTRNDEQHIIQKTMHKKRYPVCENELEFDLDLTNLKDSSLLSEREFVEILSTSSAWFYEILGELPGINSSEFSTGIKS